MADPQAFIRGLSCRCPACGKGRLFGRFLKPAASCAECAEEFHHQRADDFPAYVVVVIVGHIVVPLAVFTEKHFSPEYWVHMALWLPMVLVMTGLLLQPVKGAIIALQWKMGLHGFSDAKKRREQKTS